MQFDCGFTVSNTRINLSSMEQSLPKVNDIISGKIQIIEQERNNSYFGKRGTSMKYDELGNYIDPMKR